MRSLSVFIRYFSSLAFFLSVGSSALGQVYRPGEVIIKLKGTTKSVTATSFLGKVQMESRMKLQGSWKTLNVHHFKSTTGHTTQQLIDIYRNDPAVQYVEPNYIFKKMDVEGSQEVVSSRGSVGAMAAAGSFSQNSSDIGVESAWGILSSSGTKPVVAVIDTGVDYNHSVFTQAGAIWENSAEVNGTTGVDDDGNGYVDDYRGWNFVANDNDPMDDNNHGTHVAGIILGVGQDIINTSPVDSSRMEIMPLKFLDSSGSGSTAAAINAVYYAVNNGAKVLNNSWGGGAYSAALHEALAYAYKAEVFIAAAAGNESTNNDVVPTYPANYDVPSMASIAATTDSDFLAGFSNFGSSTVHVGSPGSQIYSTLPNNTFGNLSGTSMATPLVAGMAALILFERPAMTGYQVREVIFGQSEAQSSLSAKTTTKSRVNVYQALAEAKGVDIDSSQPDYEVSVDQFGRDLASTMDGGACGLIRGGADGGPTPPLYILILMTLLVAPLFVARYLRKDELNRRQHERFEIDSDVSLVLGGRRMIGKVSSISQGGLQLNTEEMLEKGSVVSMVIRSPETGEEVKVEGHIVWSEDRKRYGVQFLEKAVETSAGLSRLMTNLKPEKD